MDRFLSQFKLLDFLGYLTPGLVLLLGLIPVAPQNLAQQLALLERIPGGLVAALLLAAYSLGFILSTVTDRLVSRWQTGRKCEEIFKHVGELLEMKLGLALGADLKEFTQPELRALAEAIIRGRPSGDEIDRLIAIRRFCLGLAATFSLIALAHFLFGGWLVIAVPSLAFAVAAVCVSRGDHECMLNNTIASGLVELVLRSGPTAVEAAKDVS